METKRIPTVVYAESTPNPSTIKFVANRLVVENNANIEYTDSTQTSNSPLAQQLFNFPFVKGLYFSGNFISVTKNDLVSWDNIVLELREYIQQYLSEGKIIFSSTPEANCTEDHDNESAYGHAQASNDIEQRIVDLLEEYVRPAVEQDGGAIFFQSFNDGIVTVSLRGACSGCPSSSMTLKAGIEGLLKRMIPEVTEVVAEAC